MLIYKVVKRHRTMEPSVYNNITYKHFAGNLKKK